MTIIIYVKFNKELWLTSSIQFEWIIVYRSILLEIVQEDWRVKNVERSLIFPCLKPKIDGMLLAFANFSDKLSLRLEIYLFEICHRFFLNGPLTKLCVLRVTTKCRRLSVRDYCMHPDKITSKRNNLLILFQFFNLRRFLFPQRVYHRYSTYGIKVYVRTSHVKHGISWSQSRIIIRLKS